MVNGDIAIAAGLSTVPATEDARLGYDRINETRDLLLKNVNAGTGTRRDAVYGVPTLVADQVALANAEPRWFNTDKGWEEQYYAAYNAAGVTASTPVRDVAGWAPSLRAGRVPLTRFTTTGVKKGGKAEFTNAATVALDALFTTDFDRYEVEVTASAASAALNLTLQFRAGGAANTTANYFHSFAESATAGLSQSVTGTAASSSLIGRVSLVGASIRILIVNPAQPRRTWTHNTSLDSDSVHRTGGASFALTNVFDGFVLATGGATMTGDIRVYGLTT